MLTRLWSAGHPNACKDPHCGHYLQDLFTTFPIVPRLSQVLSLS